MKYIKGFNNINESMSREGMINVIRNILRESYDLNNNANIVDVINKFSEKLFLNDSDKEAFSTSIIGDMLSESIVLVDDFDRSVKFKEVFHGPTIAYSEDIENDKVSFRDGYFSGTAIVGGDDAEDKGEEDYSSPFHKGQVISNDEFEEGVEEVDFRYSRRMPSNIVRQKLEEYVSKNYNGKIIKITYH
jgi:hypothetical protein